jgi:hypothetical protein
MTLTSSLPEAKINSQMTFRCCMYRLDVVNRSDAIRLSIGFVTRRALSQSKKEHTLERTRNLSINFPVIIVSFLYLSFSYKLQICISLPKSSPYEHARSRSITANYPGLLAWRAWSRSLFPHLFFLESWFLSFWSACLRSRSDSVLIIPFRLIERWPVLSLRNSSQHFCFLKSVSYRPRSACLNSRDH